MINSRQDREILSEAYMSIYREAKDERPGARLKGVKDREGPVGMTASPVGRDTYNPEKLVAKKEPRDRGSFSVRDTKNMVRYAFELIGSIESTRDELAGENGVLTNHVEQLATLRSLKGEQERWMETNKGIHSSKLEREIKRVSALIGERIKGHAILDDVTQALSTAAVELKKKMEDESNNITQLNDLSQLKPGMIRGVDEEQLQYISAIVNDPQPVVDAFRRWYINEEESGSDPISYMVTLYKNGAIKGGLLDKLSKRTGIKPSHVLGQKNTPEMQAAANYIKSARGNYGRLDSEVFASKLETAVNKGIIDGAQANTLKKIFNELLTGNKTEADLNKLIYNPGDIPVGESRQKNMFSMYVEHITNYGL